MSLQINNVKKRIKTISGTLKVTNAMKLVSTVRLQRWKNMMLNNREYSLTMDEITKVVLSHVEKCKSPFAKVNSNATKNLYIIMSSTLGLCGSYNYNIFDLAESKLKKEDDAIILGKKGIIHFKDGDFKTIDDFNDYSSISDEKIIKSLTSYLMKAYSEGIYKEIHMIYTSYKNSLIFLAKDELILPIKKQEEDFSYGPILEPTPNELVDRLIPIYVQTGVYQKLLESEVCEQAARCNAMGAASDNANEILDTLKIEYNKARQAAITQEITEIVSAANAM